ncbi:Glucosyl-3-phosphoglycerate phosphatase [Corynebacterium guangdongense]|uniref:Phosphoglycerate mutase n=1 Tax=Corynebacterium guangdongense TaxID=1783348 RepID=A0ABU1ZZJ1_9CORY|nr:bifunctional RNase H/acid phosphatase [Corynebacterium guangdongense]MDR7329818.1 putative phosphoglycerate mutase [Corynebacterium guangdongense]WJZ18381.1 Glucosyl-3-phosphoglycerate phosphatase [Corynebacterium guangdongense]
MSLKVNVFADGGSRGNPGVAGSGTAVYDAATGDLLREIVYVVGRKSTNNVAEYHGLLRGLEAAAELGASEVYVFLDSKLVVEQMSGRWKIKHPDMQKLAMEARRLAQQFDRVAYTWVPRAQNTVADKLSNDAMDAAASGHEPGIVGGASAAELARADSGAPAGSAATTLFTNGNGDTSLQEHQATTAWTGATHQPTRLILLRHGQTEMSAAGVYAGLRDVPLTDLGRRQAEAAAEVLVGRGIDVVVSSPLSRCTQTADAVATRLGLTVEIINDLRECDFGDYEGKTFDEADAMDPAYHQAWVTDSALAAPNGESNEDVNKRVRAVRRQLEKRYPGKTVLVVSHVNPIKSFLRQAFGAGKSFYAKLFLPLAAISVVDLFGSQAPVPMVVRSVGEYQHIEGLK